MLAANDLEAEKDALQYLDLAGKFVNHSEYMLAKGILFSKLGRFS